MDVREGPGNPVGTSWRGWPWLLACLLVALAVHAPSLGLGFVGDDFEWWLAARTAFEEPSRLIQPFGGFRPANLWTLAVDCALYGTDPAGFHLTSIVLHLACGVLLWRTFVGFEFRPATAAGLTALWLCSPYTLKPVVSLCERFQPLLLLAWLGLLLLWPRRGAPWRRCTILGVITIAAASALVKETWVVLPGLVLCFELWLHGVRPARAVATALVAAIGPVIYTVVYALDPPIASSYFAGSLAPAAKIPHSWALFSGFTALDPSSSQFGVAELAALVMMAALAWWAWRRGCAVTAVGFALFLLPFLPIVTVGFLVTRYTYIPLVGFLLVVAGAARAARSAVPAARRRLAAAALALVGLGYLGHSLWWLRGDLVDARRRDQAHRGLLAEARAFAPSLPRSDLLLGVRLERRSVNRELLAAIRGVPKAYYERTRHPYALIAWAPLFSYVLEPAGGPLFESAAPASSAATVALIGHRDGGFVVLSATTDEARVEAESWAQRGFFVEGFRPLAR